MERRIVNSKEVIILDSLKLDNCKACILDNARNGYAHVRCPIDNTQKRIGFVSGNNGKVFACSANASTTKTFRIELQNCLDSIPQLMRFRKEVEHDVCNRFSVKVDMLVHNLKSQNAHAIQELYNFVTEQDFYKNINESVETVLARIESRKRFAAVLFLRLAKINSAMDNEIFIYENLIKSVPNLTLSPRYYNLRDVVMLIFHEFMEDFNKKKVYIDAEEYYERVKFDYRTTRFVIYHIISNASKYVKPNSDIKVSFDKTDCFYVVRFVMTSYRMDNEVLEHIYEEGYSGKQAKQLATAGQGLGMYLAKRVTALNGLMLSIDAGKQIDRVNNVEYAVNVFEISIPYT